MVANTPMDAQAFLQPGFRYAVVGATTNTAKYGYRVLQDLHGAGLPVVGVNPKYTSITGIPCFPDLGSLPWKPDVVIVVVPPHVGVAVVEQAANLGMRRVWLQPGAESDAVLERARAHGMVTNDPGTCIMVARRLVR